MAQTSQILSLRDTQALKLRVSLYLLHYAGTYLLLPSFSTVPETTQVVVATRRFAVAGGLQRWIRPERKYMPVKERKTFSSIMSISQGVLYLCRYPFLNLSSLSSLSFPQFALIPSIILLFEQVSYTPFFTFLDQR